MTISFWGRVDRHYVAFCSLNDLSLLQFFVCLFFGILVSSCRSLSRTSFTPYRVAEFSSLPLVGRSLFLIKFFNPYRACCRTPWTRIGR